MSDWNQFKKSYLYLDSVGIALDFSRVGFPESFLADIKHQVDAALGAMAKIEAGDVANIDEQRMVGHYWLRDSSLAPSAEIKSLIDNSLSSVKAFSAEIRNASIQSASGEKFTDALIIGIGGSALGPKFVYDSLGRSTDGLKLHLFDNTDPDGMGKTLDEIDNLSTTLCIVISKSGGTRETLNGMLVARAAYQKLGLKFAEHTIAITGDGSSLEKIAQEEGWLKVFPMWDWVGGRTSETSAVGMLPAALQGVDIDGFRAGAREMDVVTRRKDCNENPAALLALSWYHLAEASGSKAMVVLPYKDRLQLFSQYLQQLVMESLGKKLNRDGKEVFQGLTVYGNKGSTDQHAYVQQLRDGLNNFFVVFIEVLKDTIQVAHAPQFAKDAEAVLVDGQMRSGDYLHGFCLGTRSALCSAGRRSISITLDSLSAESVGALIALFERTVGIYAELININAYHQPGVQAGKKAAQEVVALEQRVLAELKGKSLSVDELAEALGENENQEIIFRLVRYLSANDRLKVQSGEDLLFNDRYSIA